jgi:hypothetical protein
MMTKDSGQLLWYSNFFYLSFSSLSFSLNHCYHRNLKSYFRRSIQLLRILNSPASQTQKKSVSFSIINVSQGIVAMLLRIMNIVSPKFEICDGILVLSFLHIFAPNFRPMRTTISLNTTTSLLITLKISPLISRLISRSLLLLHLPRYFLPVSCIIFSSSRLSLTASYRSLH